MIKPEILAPAGSPQALIAAVRSGADAVYLGIKNLNARRSAENFDDEQLKEAVAYCHKHNVKVHLTLNTLVSDGELEKAQEAVQLACEAGVDAIIVQDIGIAELIHRTAPDMPLHASTQMSVQTAAGLKRLKRLGFTRAVLPRELSKRKSKSFAKIRLLSLNALYTVRFACAFQANVFSAPFSVHEAATEAHVLNRAGYPSRLKTEQAMT